MKEINGYLLVEIPENAKNVEINDYDLGYPVLDWDVAGMYQKVDLDAGSYDVIGRAKDLTEEQWKGIVDGMYLGENPVGKYENYGFGLPKFDTATESGHSLLKANGLNPDNCLILKNENR